MRKSFCRHWQYCFCSHYQHKFSLRFQDHFHLSSLLRLYCNQRGASALFFQEVYLKQTKSLTSKLEKIILNLYLFKKLFSEKSLKNECFKIPHTPPEARFYWLLMLCIVWTEGITQTMHIHDKCDDEINFSWERPEFENLRTFHYKKHCFCSR